MPTKLTSMRFTDDDLALLLSIQHHVGTNTRTEALRVLMRSYCRQEGIEPQPKKPMRSRSKATAGKAGA